MSESRGLVIFAAGNGTRMGTSQPKTLTKIPGIGRIIDHLFRETRGFFDETHLVIQSKHLQSFRELENCHTNIKFHVQDHPRGTAFALRDCIAQIENQTIVTLWGDQLGLCRELVEMLLVQKNRVPQNSILVPLCLKKNPYVSFEIKNGQAVGFVDLHESNQEYGFQDSGLLAASREVFIQLLHLAEETFHKAEGENLELNLMKIVTSFPTIIPCRPLIHTLTSTTLGINSSKDLQEYLGH